MSDEVIAPNLNKTLSEDSSSTSPDISSDSSENKDEEPPRKRRKRDWSRDLNKRFDLLSQQLVSHVNNILIPNYAITGRTPVVPLSHIQIPTSCNNNVSDLVSSSNRRSTTDEQFLRRPLTEAGSFVDLSVSIKEPTVPKAIQTRVDKIKDMQRFDSPAWNAVRYSDVQKKYAAFPAFTELKVNEEFRCLENSFSPLRWFQMERSFAALSQALLAQNECVNTALQNLVDWSNSADVQLNAFSIYEKLKQLFGNDSGYKTVSHDILQIICGKRAEVLEIRRRDLLKKLKDKYIREDIERIPPSCDYMFNPGLLSAYIQKIGGIDKLQKQAPSATRSRPKSPEPSTSTTTSKPFRSRPNFNKTKEAENRFSERGYPNNSSAKRMGGGGRKYKTGRKSGNKNK